MKLINNEAVDFVFALKRFADRNKTTEDNQERMPELKQWCKDTEKKLSPFLLSDISLLVEKMILPSVYLFILYTNHPGIETGTDFLDLLETVTPVQFLDYVKSKMLNEEDAEVTVEKIYDVLVNDGLHPGYDPVEESELLYGFIQDPDSFLKRLHKTYSDFYRIAYLPAKKQFSILADEKFSWHEKKLQESKREYLELLGLQNFLKFLGEETEPSLYFSFFADNDISSFWSSRSIIIGAGTDSRIRYRSARDKADIFFSCFGDPKRLEILRLTATRPWYSSELAKHFNLKPATLSYHINILTDAELLNIKKGDSRRFYYSLNNEKVEEYLQFVSQDLLGLEHENEKNTKE